MKKNIDLTGKVQFQTQFDPIFGDRKKQNVACAKASKKMIEDAGFKTVMAKDRIDAVIYNVEGKLIRSESWEKAVEMLHKNCDDGKPTLVAVNRGPQKVGNSNTASNHFVVIVGRKYNVNTGCYEYRFYDPGTSHEWKGKHESQYFTLKDGLWKGTSFYCKLTYVITEIRPTL